VPSGGASAQEKTPRISAASYATGGGGRRKIFEAFASFISLVNGVILSTGKCFSYPHFIVFFSFALVYKRLLLSLPSGDVRWPKKQNVGRGQRPMFAPWRPAPRRRHGRPALPEPWSEPRGLLGKRHSASACRSIPEPEKSSVQSIE